MTDFQLLLLLCFSWWGTVNVNRPPRLVEEGLRLWSYLPALLLTHSVTLNKLPDGSEPHCCLENG